MPQACAKKTVLGAIFNHIVILSIFDCLACFQGYLLYITYAKGDEIT